VDGGERAPGPDETIVWEGRPVRHRLFRASDALLVPFSVTWFAFGVFWASSAFVDATATHLWVAIFALVGLYLVAGRFVRRAIGAPATSIFGSRSSWRGVEPGDALVLWDIPDVRHVRDVLSRL